MYAAISGGAGAATVQNRASTLYYYGPDAMQNMRFLFDPEANVLDYNVYKGFGELIAGETQVNNYLWGGNVSYRWLFLMMYLLGPRVADAFIARFKQTDPLGPDGGDDNLYRIVRNSPLGWTDPSGLVPNPYVCPSCYELRLWPACYNASQTIDKAYDMSWQHYCDHPATHCYTCCILRKTVSAACAKLAQECQDCANRRNPGTTTARTTYCKAGIANAGMGGTCSQRCTSAYPMKHSVGATRLPYTPKDCCCVDCHSLPDDDPPAHFDCLWHYCCGDNFGISGSIFG